MYRVWLVALFTAGTYAALICLPPRLQAIPVFARKYKTSCQTCHVAFPKLNPFGEAFRRNGYRFPGGEDEDVRQDEPVPLGHEVHKKVWPNAVWPGEAPGESPLSFQMGSQVTFAPDAKDEIGFQGVGGNIGVNFAATLGDVFSAWGGFGLRASYDDQGVESVDVEMERVFLVIKPTEGAQARVRIGRFEPDLMGFTVHRTLGLSPWISTSVVGDNTFSIDPVQLGVELSGVGAGRLAYSAGYVEGSGNRFETPKDIYGRLAYKFGGMQLDGVGGATDANPWREKSAIIGFFAYRGLATVGDPELASQDDEFWIVGSDANLTFNDANLQLGLLWGHNKRPTLATPRISETSWQFFSQLDYVIFPWLIPTLRYEHRELASGLPEDRVAPGVYCLITSNVRTQAIFDIQAVDYHFDLAQVQLGINLAF